MKIAISTNDSLRMAPAFENSDGFLILTIVLGEIAEEEMRWKHETGKQERKEQFSLISDCSHVFVRDISESSMQLFRDKSISVIRTDEEIITNMIVHYLEHASREDSNTCCCP